MNALTLRQAWAKTDPASQKPAVSVLTHSINVGAVAAGIVERLSPAVRSLFPAETWRGLVCLAALHDCGKISPGFLRKCEAWLRQAAPDPRTARDWASREKNHAWVSHIHLGKFYGKTSHAGYAVAVGGHHGRFTGGVHNLPAASESGAASREFNDADFRAVRDELLARVQAGNIFGALPPQPLSAKGPDATLVVFLTGLITLADWLGSDEDFFALHPPRGSSRPRRPAPGRAALLARAQGRGGRVHPAGPRGDPHAAPAPRLLQQGRQARTARRRGVPGNAPCRGPRKIPGNLCPRRRQRQGVRLRDAGARPARLNLSPLPPAAFSFSVSSVHTMKLLELHLLQSYPVSCLNRDDVGSPKTAEFGGVGRARLSSQCLKRAVREYARDHYPAEARFGGLRSRLLVAPFTEAFRTAGLSEEKALEQSRLTCNALSKINDKKNPNMATTAVFLSPGEITQVA